MKTTSISRYGHQLTRFAFVNCYLVQEDDGFTLVDASLFASSAPPIIAAAEALGAPIRRILLTHAHTDHVGAVDALVAALGPDVELACSERSVPMLKTPPDNALRPGEPAGKVTSGPGIATQPRRLLEDGARYGSLLSIDTPGHMPGHLSFLDERDGTLYAGDALTAKGRLAVSGSRPGTFRFPISPPGTGSWRWPARGASRRFASSASPAATGACARAEAPRCARRSRPPDRRTALR